MAHACVFTYSVLFDLELIHQLALKLAGILRISWSWNSLACIVVVLPLGQQPLPVSLCPLPLPL